jgi:uncharacterized membrane protein YuzA (DUF378 family)
VFGRKRNSKQRLNSMDRAAGAVVGFGALNWGLVGLANFDAVKLAFGKSAASRAVYGAVGAAGVYALMRGRQLSK